MPPREEEQKKIKTIKAFWGTDPKTQKEVEDEEKNKGGKEKETKDPLKELLNFEIAQRKLEGDEEGVEELINEWLKMNIDKVEDEWNAEKYKER